MAFCVVCTKMVNAERESSRAREALIQQQHCVGDR